MSYEPLYGNINTMNLVFVDFGTYSDLISLILYAVMQPLCAKSTS